MIEVAKGFFWGATITLLALALADTANAQYRNNHQRQLDSHYQQQEQFHMQQQRMYEQQLQMQYREQQLNQQMQRTQRDIEYRNRNSQGVIPGLINLYRFMNGQ